MATKWWENEPKAICTACGGATWSKSTPALHRKCRPVAAPRPRESWSERKRRAAAVQRHREQFGEICPGWRRPAHRVDPPNKLTADHIRSIASGGDEAGELQVLCNWCNPSKRQSSGLASGGRMLGSSGSRSPSSVASQYVPSGTC